MNIKFSLSGRGLIVFGTVEGAIITLNKHMEVNSYQLFDIDMTAMIQFRTDNIIVAGGHDSSNPQMPIIKILKLEKIDETNMRPITIVLNQLNSNITAIAVHEGMNSLAVGLSSGEVVYYKSDILKFKNEKPRVVHEAPHSITGLAFKIQINSKFPLLYVSTEYAIITIIIAGKDKDEKVFLIETSFVQCSCFVHKYSQSGLCLPKMV